MTKRESKAPATEPRRSLQKQRGATAWECTGGYHFCCLQKRNSTLHLWDETQTQFFLSIKSCIASTMACFCLETKTKGGFDVSNKNFHIFSLHSFSQLCSLQLIQKTTLSHYSELSQIQRRVRLRSVSFSQTVKRASFWTSDFLRDPETGAFNTEVCLALTWESFIISFLWMGPDFKETICQDAPYSKVTLPEDSSHPPRLSSMLHKFAYSELIPSKLTRTYGLCEFQPDVIFAISNNFGQDDHPPLETLSSPHSAVPGIHVLSSSLNTRCL